MKQQKNPGKVNCCIYSRPEGLFMPYQVFTQEKLENSKAHKPYKLTIPPANGKV